MNKLRGLVRLAAPIGVAAAALAASRDASAQAVNERTDPALQQRVETARRDVAGELREEPTGKAGPLIPTSRRDRRSGSAGCLSRP